jgi:hypothetical protein
MPADDTTTLADVAASPCTAGTVVVGAVVGGNVVVVGGSVVDVELVVVSAVGGSADSLSPRPHALATINPAAASRTTVLVRTGTFLPRRAGL